MLKNYHINFKVNFSKNLTKKLCKYSSYNKFNFKNYQLTFKLFKTVQKIIQLQVIF